MIRRDYLLRAIEELAQALARVVNLRQAAQHEDALRAVEAAKGALPLVPGVVDQLDVESLREQWAGTSLCDELGHLYQHEAELCYVLGMKARAVRCLTRARALQADVPGLELPTRD